MKKSCVELSACVLGAASVVGEMERAGPLGSFFDLCDEEQNFGCDTWEKAESEMQRRALAIAMGRADCRDGDIGALFAGDLINQCVGSAYGLLQYDIPYFGLYGACSTSGEGLMLASILTTHGVYSRCAAVTSSHFCTAERQYRTPLEYGSQRPPTAQWTVTGAGAFVVGAADAFPAVKHRIVRALPGRVLEKGIKDAGNMGAAMAPAAADSLLRFFSETGTEPSDYDRIVTGDLGYEGGDILCSLLDAEGCSIREQYADCGRLIYDRRWQDVHSGGSGCGCSATVLASYLIPAVNAGEWKRILFLPTGALMSPDSLKQGQAIPGIAHLLELEHRKTEERDAE